MGIPSREQDDAAQVASIAVWRASLAFPGGDMGAWLGKAMENSLSDYKDMLGANKRTREVMGYGTDE